MKSKLFEREIKLIMDYSLQDFVRYYLDKCVGDWFWKSGSSASGRFHPEFTHGEGGLVRHTRAVAMVCEEMLRLNVYAYMRDEYKDYARVACLLHDTCKYGTSDTEDKSCYAQHGDLAAENVKHEWEAYFNEPAPELLLMAIRSHMGQWTEPKENRPFTNIDRLVHLADYIASRSFWDIPQITAEYEADTHPFDILDDEELPF